MTNGVHVPTWIEPKMELLFNKYLGDEWVKDHDNPLIWEGIDSIPDEELWQTHYWMKAALNGVPHLSILDGWWVEGFTENNGWAFGEKQIPDNRDPMDAAAIYGILEKEVIPSYYSLSDDGLSHKWIGIMKEAIKSSAAAFSTRRMAKEYIRKFYVNALKCCR